MKRGGMPDSKEEAWEKGCYGAEDGAFFGKQSCSRFEGFTLSLGW